MVGKNCDFQLIAKNGVAIQAHSLILRTYAEDFFVNLLSPELSGLVESKKKMISLSEYSERAIRAFIDFIYLGGPEFQEKLMSSEYSDLDIWELLEFAHKYQVLVLVDCCTNLISRLATIDEADGVFKAAKLYNNDHLYKLYEELVMSDVD